MADSDRERLKGHLDLLLLSVLARGPAHGYAVIADLRAASGGAFDLREGTVYPALHRLERSDLLRSSWGRAGDSEHGRRRKVYALTAAGEAALVTESSGWRRFADGVGSVLRTVGRPYGASA